MVGTTYGFSPASPTPVALARPQWDPRTVIAIENPYSGRGATCVGTAKHGSRCGWFSSSIQPTAARAALDRISQQAPDPVALESKLREVARDMLCHWHGDQVDDVVVKWQAGIRVVLRDYVPPPVQPEPVRPPRPGGDTRTAAAPDAMRRTCDDFAIMKQQMASYLADAAKATAELATKNAQQAEARAEAACRENKLAQERATKLAADLEAERATAVRTRAAAVEESKRLTALREQATSQLEQVERESSALSQERSVLEEERSALEEGRSVLEEERSVLEEERSALEESLSTLDEARSTLESTRAGVLAAAQATEQWTAQLDKWKSEARAQKSHKLSIRTLRSRLVVPAGVLDSVPRPPKLATEVRAHPLVAPTIAGVNVVDAATPVPPVLPAMPNVPTTEPSRHLMTEGELNKPPVRKLRDTPQRRTKEMVHPATAKEHQTCAVQRSSECVESGPLLA